MNASHSRVEASPSRRGNYSIIFALSIPLMLGSGAIAVDLTLQKIVRAELQAAADIAVKAGTGHLDGTAAGLQDARDAAVRAAARNQANGVHIALDGDTIEFGYWDPDDWEFVASSDPEEIDTMRIELQVTDILTNFAESTGTSHWLQHRRLRANARSTAQQQPPTPAGSVACYIPIGIPDCLFDLYPLEDLLNLTLKLNPAGIDNAGWARIGASPNASFSRAQIQNCYQDGVATVGDDVGLQNGVVTSAMSELATAIENSGTVWNPEWGTMPSQSSKSDVSTSDYGNTFEGPIIVFDGGIDYCLGLGGAFNGTEEVVGFAWAAIYDVQTKGSAASKNIWMRLNPLEDADFGLSGGGLVDGGVIFYQGGHVVE